MKIAIDAHLQYCYQGDHAERCAYGDEDCPTNIHTFTVRIPAIDTLKRADLLETLKMHLDDFGEGEYWDETLDAPTIGIVVVE
jgi:hypothetical protein